MNAVLRSAGFSPLHRSYCLKGNYFRESLWHSRLSFILFCGFSAGLACLIMLCSGDAFIDEPFIIASPFVVLIGTGGHWHFVSG